MNKRMLGKDGFSVGEVGLGCWQFGGDFGAMEEATARRILETSVELGVDFFDTADVYGGGRSEQYIGEFLKSCDQPVRVATKYGRDGSVYPDNYTEETLMRSIEASCRRLGVDTIDLLQLHCIPLEFLRDGAVFDWLRKARDAGLIRHFGASVETVEEGLVCMEQEDLCSLQVIFNIFRQKIAEELLPVAGEKGVGVIVRLPLASGLLAGKYTKETTFEAGDHRTYNRDGQCFNVGETFAGLPFEKGVELADEVRSILPSEASMAQQSLRWILDHEAVSVIIPGASSPAQARSNAEVSALPPLKDEVHQSLRSFYREKVFKHIRGPY
ncbi:MAG: aldo/keto reductase [Pontiellaceae bacterium]|nr:aldo/keto reductase [Pontiellaceae bacterium]MBN2783840.1 aldo/keto reductase [Pontiellaceae bacterium]